MDAQIMQTMKELEKQFGIGSSMILTENNIVPFERVSTGSLNVDMALGGGLVPGKIVEIYGPESAGKTTIAILSAIEYQKKYPDKFVSIIDAEHAFNPSRASALGLDMSRVIFSQPQNAEEALDIAEAWARNGRVSLIVIDSVAALVPEAEEEGSMGDQQIGLQARLLSKFCRKMSGPLEKSKTTCICINQIREKCGFVMGNPEVTSGGRALRFYSSIRMDIRAGERLTEGKDNIIGQAVKVKVVKNKTAVPFKTAIFELRYNEGVNNMLEVVEIASLINVLIKSGAYLKLVDEAGEIIVKDGVKLSMYKKDWVDYLTDKPALYRHFRDAVLTNGQIDLDYIRNTNFDIEEEELIEE